VTGARFCPDLGDFQPSTVETLPEAAARTGLTVPILTRFNPSGVNAEAWRLTLT
jgi:hypothetical protein